MIADLTGIILAGGRSSRFGSNKALADWKGKRLVQTVAESLLTVIPKVLIVVKEKQDFRFLEGQRIRVIEDLYRETHPLGGIYTGLHYMEYQHAFICACDMPFIQQKLIEVLWEARGDYDAAIPVWQGKRQPLCGIYSMGCSGFIRSFVEQVRLEIRKLFDFVRTRFFLELEIQRVDPEGLSFVDIDTLEDYEQAVKQTCASQRSGGGRTC